MTGAGLAVSVIGFMAAHAAQPTVTVAPGADCHGVQNAIDAAAPMGQSGFGNAALVVFPSGTYAVNCTVHLKSNVVIQLDTGAHIISTADGGYDPPESTPYGAYQDEGHSIFNTAMFRGDHVSNVGFQGDMPGGSTSATIDGNGFFTTGNSSSTVPDKLISITNCDHLTLSNITLIRGGHFEALTNHCDQVQSDHLDVEAATSRDGWNVIDVTNATFTNLTDHGNDDGLVFKSDWALGATYPSGNVTVTNAHLSAGCCNALMFGSETCGDFTNYEFTDITITGAGKSGIGIISSDGAHISHLFYDNLTMSGSNNAIMTARIWNRKRCGTLTGDGIGSISDVHFNTLTTSTTSTAYSPTLWGFDNATHNISNMTFQNVSFTTPSGEGGGSIDTLPTANFDYNPNAIGPRPAYGMFMHDVNGVTFSGGSFHNPGDTFPAIDVIGGSNVCLDQETLDASQGTSDIHLNGVSGYSITRSTQTGGHALRVTTTGSNAAPVNCALLPGATPTPTPSPSKTPTPTPTPSKTPTPTPNATPTPTPKPSPTPSPSPSPSPSPTPPSGGLTVSNLVVADTANASHWSVQSNLQVGSTEYGDRTYTFASVPAPLAGATWIRTANASKQATESPLVTFTVSRQVTVYLAVDHRIGKRPWMDSTWVATGTTVKDSTGVTFDVYSKTMAAGQIALGPNAATTTSSSNYTIVLV